MKWRHWKFHLVWQEYMYDIPQRLPLPRLFQPARGSRERHDVFLPSNTWVKVLGAKTAGSLAAKPEQASPIAAGTPDPYQP
ncbi:MAG: hypothetical protein R3E68_01480 [Burkholderiaceae bacterium]